MFEATTAHNPDRVIAYSLTGPVYAPDSWSDEQVSKFKEQSEATSSARKAARLVSDQDCAALAKLLCRELLAVQTWNACCPGQGLRNWRLFPSCARTAAAFREPAKSAQTSFQEKVSAYRISMVVVAIAMVVGLRGLVNLLSQHTRTDGGV